MTPPLVVLVEFRVKPEDHDEFRRLLTENATASRKGESGCKQFDVLISEAGPTGAFILYEIYNTDAEFKAHLQTDHYLQFEKASAAMILERKITQLRHAAPNGSG
jgi:quinol monooxygenase YgiN